MRPSWRWMLMAFALVLVVSAMQAYLARTDAVSAAEVDLCRLVIAVGGPVQEARREGMRDPESDAIGVAVNDLERSADSAGDADLSLRVSLVSAWWAAYSTAAAHQDEERAVTALRQLERAALDLAARCSDRGAYP